MYRKRRHGKSDEPLQLTAALTSAFALTLFVVHPWVIGPLRYNNITAVKLGFFIAVFSLYALAMIVCLAIKLPRRRVRIRELRLRAITFAAAVYIALMLISALGSGNVRESFFGASARNEGLLVRSAYAITAVLIALFYVPKKRDLLALCICAAAVSAYGILEFFGFDPLRLLPRDYFARYGGQVMHVAAMSNIDVYSTYASMALCAGIVMAARERGKARIAYLICGVITAATLALCGVWSGLFGIAASLGSLMPWIVFRKPARRAVAVWYGAIAAAGISGCIVIASMAGKSGNLLLADIAALLRGELRDTFGSRRGLIWKRAWALWREKPLFGWGPDGFRGAYLNRWGVFSGDGRYAIFDKAHNEYLQTIVDIGAAGAAAYIVLLSCAIRAGFRAVREESAALAALAATICFAAQGIFNISSPFAHPAAWALIGMCASSAGAIGKKNENIHIGDECNG
ncbi:MAG: O-antigen ligase family protein [Oscillospiraceae bacterium]|jgi:O-antigen ligase|nr:O-antigen ligase family protein [Oscillospiraceae bacterium]